MKVKQARGVQLLAAAVAALAGCGGGSDGGSTSTRRSRPRRPRPRRRRSSGPRRRAEDQRRRARAPAGTSGRCRSSASSSAPSSRSIGNADAKAGRKQVVVNLRRVKVRLRRAGVELGEITPPPTVAAAHRQLIAAVREYADELSGIIADVKGGDRAALAKDRTGQRGGRDGQGDAGDRRRRLRHPRQRAADALAGCADDRDRVALPAPAALPRRPSRRKPVRDELVLRVAEPRRAADRPGQSASAR